MVTCVKELDRSGEMSFFFYWQVVHLTNTSHGTSVTWGSVGHNPPCWSSSTARFQLPRSISEFWVFRRNFPFLLDLMAEQILLIRRCDSEVEGVLWLPHSVQAKKCSSWSRKAHMMKSTEKSIILIFMVTRYEILFFIHILKNMKFRQFSSTSQSAEWQMVY